MTEQEKRSALCAAQVEMKDNPRGASSGNPARRGMNTVSTLLHPDDFKRVSHACVKLGMSKQEFVMRAISTALSLAGEGKIQHPDD